MGITEHSDAFVMGARGRITPQKNKKKSSKWKEINSPPTSPRVMDLTFISTLSTHAFGFILHLRCFSSVFLFYGFIKSD